MSSHKIQTDPMAGKSTTNYSTDQTEVLLLFLPLSPQNCFTKPEVLKRNDDTLVDVEEADPDNVVADEVDKAVGV